MTTFLAKWDGTGLTLSTAGNASLKSVIEPGRWYHFALQEDRSSRSHRHYHAAIHEAWLNLPEEYADRFPTSEHFRKWLLIHCGYADERSISCSSRAEALRVGAFVKPMDEYAVVTIREAVVKVYTAQSQSMRAMGKAVFQASKTAVLERAASLIGTTATELQRAGEAA